MINTDQRWEYFTHCNSEKAGILNLVDSNLCDIDFVIKRLCDIESGLFFFRKKCISSGTPGGKWKIAISSNFFRKKLEGMEDIGRIILFSIGCSKYVVWNNKRYLAYFTKIVKIGKPFQDDNLSFIFVYLHIYGEAQLHLPASQVHARLIRTSNYPGFGSLSKKYHNTVCGISCMSYTLTV